ERGGGPERALPQPLRLGGVGPQHPRGEHVVDKGLGDRRRPTVDGRLPDPDPAVVAGHLDQQRRPATDVVDGVGHGFLQREVDAGGGGGSDPGGRPGGLHHWRLRGGGGSRFPTPPRGAPTPGRSRPCWPALGVVPPSPWTAWAHCSPSPSACFPACGGPGPCTRSGSATAAAWRSARRRGRLPGPGCWSRGPATTPWSASPEAGACPSRSPTPSAWPSARRTPTAPAANRAPVSPA